MNNKTYKSISEVSELLKLKKHVIRYWDSNFEGISTRLGNNKRRIFNSKNIKKLYEIKNILHKDGKTRYSLELAKQLINKKNKTLKNNLNKLEKNNYINKLHEISQNLKKIIKS